MSSDIQKHQKSGQPEQPQQQQQLQGYTFIKTLGKGNFGKVKLGLHVLTGQYVAIKILQKDLIFQKADIERISRQIKIMKLIRHPNIIQLYEIIELPKRLYLIMQYAEGGDLFDLIVKTQRLNQKNAAQYFSQIILGLEYLHSKGVAHRDMKPQNILIQKGQIKIADFGLGNFFNQGEMLKTACGSPCYASPQMLQRIPYNPQKIDIWSSGIILYAMVCGYLPFEDEVTTRLYQKIKNNQPRYPKCCSDGLKSMLKKILDKNPQTRYSITQIKQDPWLKKQYQGPKVQQFEVQMQKLTKICQIYGINQQQKLVNYLKKNKHNNLTTIYYLACRSKMDDLPNQDKSQKQVNKIKQDKEKEKEKEKEKQKQEKEQKQNNQLQVQQAPLATKQQNRIADRQPSIKQMLKQQFPSNQHMIPTTNNTYKFQDQQLVFKQTQSLIQDPSQSNMSNSNIVQFNKKNQDQINRIQTQVYQQNKNNHDTSNNIQKQVQLQKLPQKQINQTKIEQKEEQKQVSPRKQSQIKNQISFSQLDQFSAPTRTQSPTNQQNTQQYHPQEQQQQPSVQYDQNAKQIVNQIEDYIIHEPKEANGQDNIRSQQINNKQHQNNKKQQIIQPQNKPQPIKLVDQTQIKDKNLQNKNNLKQSQSNQINKKISGMQQNKIDKQKQKTQKQKSKYKQVQKQKKKQQKEPIKQKQKDKYREQIKKRVHTQPDFKIIKKRNTVTQFDKDQYLNKSIKINKQKMMKTQPNFYKNQQNPKKNIERKYSHKQSLNNTLNFSKKIQNNKKIQVIPIKQINSPTKQVKSQKNNVKTQRGTIKHIKKTPAPKQQEQIQKKPKLIKNSRMQIVRPADPSTNANKKPPALYERSHSRDKPIVTKKIIGKHINNQPFLLDASRIVLRPWHIFSAILTEKGAQGRIQYFSYGKTCIYISKSSLKGIRSLKQIIDKINSGQIE